MFSYILKKHLLNKSDEQTTKPDIKEQRNFIVNVVKKDYVIFIIIPIISFILMLAYVGFQIWNYKQFSYNENGRYVIKSIIDLSNLKEILRYVYLNLGENITRINSIFDKYSMIIYLVIPAMFFFVLLMKAL